MKRYVMAAFAVFFMSAANADEVKSLSLHLNAHVVVHITNQTCPMPEYKAKYPWAAVASRSDGVRLVGCYRGRGDMVEIQWQDIDGEKSDISLFPANAFLQTQL